MASITFALSNEAYSIATELEESADALLTLIGILEREGTPAPEIDPRTTGLALMGQIPHIRNMVNVINRDITANTERLKCLGDTLHELNSKETAGDSETA